MFNQNPLLVNLCNMKEVLLPLEKDREGGEGVVNIFLSEDFYTNNDKCLVLIQGTGPVRAGIWARYCCMNESLDLGSMIPYVEKAKEQHYSCIIFNPNFNTYPDKAGRIPYNKTMDSHSSYVWKNFIKNHPVKSLYIVAHSAGGYCTSVIFSQNTEDFMKRVRCIALTDSFMSGQSTSEAQDFLRKRVVFFNAHSGFHGSLLSARSHIEVSAGHPKHEYASGHSCNMIFDLFYMRDLLDSP